MNTHLDFSDSIIVETAPQAQACIIWLHGLGADGSDFVPIVQQLPLPETLGVKFIFPHAPIRPVAINNNFAMRAWFDIYSLNRLERHDHAGTEASEAGIRRLIEKQLEHFPSEKIMLAGFSQGGAMALFAGLRFPQKLGGIIALSTYLPYTDLNVLNASAINKDIPIFLAHGTHDSVLTIGMGYETEKRLKQWGYPVAWHEYDMAHEVCSKEIKAVAEFITENV